MQALCSAVGFERRFHRTMFDVGMRGMGRSLSLLETGMSLMGGGRLAPGVQILAFGVGVVGRVVLPLVGRIRVGVTV